jgi:hypothetical protein
MKWAAVLVTMLATNGTQQIADAVAKGNATPNVQEAIAAQTGEVDIETRKAQMAELDRNGGCDLEKLKQQLTEIIEQRIALIIQESTLIEQAKLTPSQAHEIKALVDELGDKEQAAKDEGGSAYNIVHKIISDDDDCKRLAKEAKNPAKALDAARKQRQRDDMECDRDEAKQQARESGDSWSEMKDDWERDWVETNWNEEQFQNEYKEDWKRDHGQEFPNSNFAAAA